MHPHIAAVTSRLATARASLRDAVDAVPPAARSARPHPDRWSVNEVLEHLSIVEALFTKRIGDAIARAREDGLGEETGERVPLPEDIERLVADRVNRRTAPEPARPTGRFGADAAWVAVERSRDGLVATLTSVDGAALSRVVSSHPAFGALNVYQFTELIAAHEVRHARQIMEISEMLQAGAGQ